MARPAELQAAGLPPVAEARLDRLLSGVVAALSRQIRPDGTLMDPHTGAPTPPDHYGQVAAALALILHHPDDPRGAAALAAWSCLPRRRRGHAPFNRFLLLLLAGTPGAPAAAAAACADTPLARHYPANNWVLLAQLCRLLAAPAPRRAVRAAQALHTMLVRWTTAEGGFIDFPARPGGRGGATPMTYHHKALFVAVVAARRSGSPALAAQAQRLLAWADLCWDGNGHAGGFGRSSHALFGDACLVAALLLLGPRAGPSGSAMLTGIVGRWEGQQRPDGLLELNPGAELRGDSYLHLSVYNAWAAAILSWARRTGGVAPLSAAVAVPARRPLRHDAAAGLLRLAGGGGASVLLATTGQPPQTFSRQRAELRYAGGLPFHVSRDGVPLVPAPVCIDGEVLRASPAAAGWTPLLEVDGVLFACIQFRLAALTSRAGRVRVVLQGHPVPLQRPASPDGRLSAALEWRLAPGFFGRRAALRREPVGAIDATLVLEVATAGPEVVHELTLRHRAPGAGVVTYLNPAGHAVITSAPPRQRWLGAMAAEEGAWQEVAMPSAIAGARGICRAPQPLPPGSRYAHRLVVRW